MCAGIHTASGSLQTAERSYRPCVQYFDGGSRRNPGPAGCGAALFATGSSTPVATASAYLGEATSNEAEYQGLIMGLQLALRHGVRAVLIRGDSKLVVSQLVGSWQVKKPHLAALLDLVNARLLPRIERWQAKHVRRESNAVADRLANEAMDKGARGAEPCLPSDEL